MSSIKTRSFARAGLLGNPSDGYFGKTLSFAFADYCVDLTLSESARMRFVPGEVDDAMFDSPEQLVHDLRLFGYYGGIRMLKAVAKLFFEYCFEHGIEIPERNFTAEYRTNIPRLVGLSGSSAICSAMLKALCRFYEVPIGEGGIPKDYAPTICLEAERDELGINCGFQDRVIQMYGGLVFMDFRKDYVLANNRGIYEELDPSLISSSTLAHSLNSTIPQFHNSTISQSHNNSLNLYIAFDPNRAEDSGQAHKKVKRLFEEKKPDILSAMSEFADIAQQGRDLLVSQSLNFANPQSPNSPILQSHNPTISQSSNQTIKQFSQLINANFDLRDRIFNVAEENRRMVMVARSVGASAKFAGSGGAIVGTFEDEEQFTRLGKALAQIGCTTFVPTIGTRDLESADLRKAKHTSWRNS